MSYQRTTWTNQEVERPKTYEITNNSDGSITLVESFGEVSDLGTAVNAENMNNIEDGIEELYSKMEELESCVFAIGDPIFTLSEDLGTNEIWLNGAEVSKTTYSALYSVYGDTYGTPEDEDNFILPDFRDRAVWGADDFGYLDAGLPNHDHTYQYSLVTYGTGGTTYSRPYVTTYGAGDKGFLTSTVLSDEIYGNSDTVQPPAIKVRVKTKYKI